MGIFDSLFGRRPSSPAAPQHLREALFAAVAAGNGTLLVDLCRANQAAIERQFGDWCSIPKELASNAAALQHYANGLIAVARCFDEVLGIPSLLERLQGPPDTNPITRWQGQLRQATRLFDDARFHDAVEVLTLVLSEAQTSLVRSDGVERLMAIANGYLGSAYFQNAQAAEAVAPMHRALTICEKLGDHEGVTTYLRSLYDVYRYLGQGTTAADTAERLARVLEEHGRRAEARRFATLARMVRHGEPRNRVVAVVNGERFEVDELRAVGDARISFEFERNRPTLLRATSMTERGRQLGSASRYEEALAALRTATGFDPYDPHPHYEAGFTLLHLRRYVEAVDAYQIAEELAPGWFHCRSDLWLARQLADARLPHEVFLALQMMEDSSFGPEQKVDRARRIIAAAPSLALAHYHHGIQLGHLGRHREAEAAFRDGLACAEEPDIRTRLLLHLGTTVASATERYRLLNDAILENGNLTAAATAWVALHTADGPVTGTPADD